MAEETFIKCQHNYSHVDKTRELNVRLILTEVLCLEFFYIKHLTRLLLCHPY